MPSSPMTWVGPVVSWTKTKTPRCAVAPTDHGGVAGLCGVFTPLSALGVVYGPCTRTSSGFWESNGTGTGVKGVGGGREPEPPVGLGRVHPSGPGGTSMCVGEETTLRLLTVLDGPGVPSRVRSCTGVPGRVDRTTGCGVRLDTGLSDPRDRHNLSRVRGSPWNDPGHLTGFRSWTSEPLG